MLRSEQITLHVRFRGGATRTVTLPNPLRSWEAWMTDAEVVGKIDQLLNTQVFSEIAATLNRNGFRPGKGQRFTSRYIARIQKQYGLLAGMGIPENRRSKRSRTLRAPQLGCSCFTFKMKFSTWNGSWLAYRYGRRLLSVSPCMPHS